VLFKFLRNFSCLLDAWSLHSPFQEQPEADWQIQQRISFTPSNFKAFVDCVLAQVLISSLGDAPSSHLFLPKMGFSIPFPLGFKIKQSMLHQSLDEHH